MTTSALRLRSIGDLLGERFYVPRYQRGYRWTPRQVEALLDDLAAFQAKDQSRDAYYCLQPVVVLKRPTGDWEVVDGQQRLTTILLVLRALDDIARMLSRSRYEIAYETREGSAQFLGNPTAETAGQYIDYHFMFKAYEAVARWFEVREPELRLDLIRCLIGKDGNGPNVRVIWYEIDRDPVDAFVRLNVGRIPLTSAELIRALLLRSDRAGLEERDAQQIAQDWDLTERRLQDDGYWYFLQSGAASPPARIEYLFDVFMRVLRPERMASLADDPLATFLVFQELFDDGKVHVWELWREFKAVVQTLEDWYEDRTLFHLVGFLVATEAPMRGAGPSLLVELLKARRERTSSDFDRYLRERIWRRFVGAELPPSAENLEDQIELLDYTKPLPVRTTLLLFNVAGLLEQAASTQRFQFDGYKRNSWDIEHVRSVAEYVPRAAADRKRWLERALEFVASPVAIAKDNEEAIQLASAITDLLTFPSPEEVAFSEVFARVRSLSGEAEARAADNSIANLALLDMGTNRSYKNAIFPVKRERIINLDRQGQFVPPATRNVFLKYYSQQPTQLLLWDDEDQSAYDRAIHDKLCAFFAPILRKDMGE
jgi:hypothetical protein